MSAMNYTCLLNVIRDERLDLLENLVDHSLELISTLGNFFELTQTILENVHPIMENVKKLEDDTYVMVGNLDRPGEFLLSRSS